MPYGKVEGVSFESVFECVVGVAGDGDGGWGLGVGGECGGDVKEVGGVGVER